MVSASVTATLTETKKDTTMLLLHESSIGDEFATCRAASLSA